MNRVLWLLLFLPVSLAYAADCQKLFEAHLESDMDLSYEAFDQTMNQGFRVLAKEGCRKKAADLIEAYIRVNSAEQRSLRWHIAQLRAMHGADAEAARYARMSLAEDEDFSKNALRWNDYVLATVAFLEEDLESLIEHRARVAEGVGEHQGNAMNLRLLDALVDNFGGEYAAALETLE